MLSISLVIDSPLGIETQSNTRLPHKKGARGTPRQSFPFTTLLILNLARQVYTIRYHARQSFCSGGFRQYPH